MSNSVCPSCIMLRIVLCLLATHAIASPTTCAQPTTSAAWPQPTSINKPGVIWWIPGSAMDRENMRYNLAQLRDAGFGGMSMVPIYGVRGEESRFLDYLSPEWIAMFEFTAHEAERLDLWLDLTPGTGWKIGGPNITPEQGERLVRVDRGADEDSPPRLGVRLLGQKVKRAAPGGAGLSIDPYSVEALQSHLATFDAALIAATDARPRAFYHDSFEYNGNWTTTLPDRFRQQHGYELTDHAEALFGRGDPDKARRVQCDYRMTLSQLHLEFLRQLKAWAHQHGSQLREQAHGAPGNILDMYALSDIPETEVFGASRFAIPGFRREDMWVRSGDDHHPLVNRMASSAAHISGGRLVSSESFTWLREHFHVALSHIKPEADALFLNGINHILYHGNCYSPQAADWPGWLFYASTEMNPRNAIWRDVPTLNAYLTRCQSLLQSGECDNDLLIYWPVYDVYSQLQNAPHIFMRVHNHPTWLSDTACGKLADRLLKAGHTFDFISDDWLGKTRVENGRLVSGQASYRALIVPATQFMPVATLARLREIAAQGVPVLFDGKLPEDVPGWGQLAARRARFMTEREKLQRLLTSPSLPLKARVISMDATLSDRLPDEPTDPPTDALCDALVEAGLPPEPLVRHGLRYIRRRHATHIDYFIVNQSASDYAAWLPLRRPADSALLMDPMVGTTRQAHFRRPTPEDPGTCQVYLQLAAGQACFIRLGQEAGAEARPEPAVRPSGRPVTLVGPWSVEFIEGGPKLPEAFALDALASWTTRDDAEARRFAGTARYRCAFTLDEVPPAGYRLDLGTVRESARVRINGQSVGTLVALPFRIDVKHGLQPGGNTLEVEVTNLSANRIRDLDARNVSWKKFYDINYVNIHYKPFDAAKWPLCDSGLLGPVTLTPLEGFIP